MPYQLLMRFRIQNASIVKLSSPFVDAFDEHFQIFIVFFLVASAYHPDHALQIVLNFISCLLSLLLVNYTVSVL